MAFRVLKPGCGAGRANLALRCYYVQWRFRSHGWDEHGDSMVGCGKCVVPHPDDHAAFVAAWARTVPWSVQRDAFVEVAVDSLCVEQPACWQSFDADFGSLRD